MFLAVDIGNSKISAAVFDGDNVVCLKSFDSVLGGTAESYSAEFKNAFKDYKINEAGIISVVNNLDKTIKNACDLAFGIDSVVLDTDFCNEIKINSDKPESAGMDRVANVYAALDYELPAIVVDIGTAVTFDILSEDKVFLGGIIMPGVNMGLKALADGTSKLPEIAAQESPKVIGNTTETCMLSGVIRGTASAIDGLLEQCSEELGGCKTVVLTGGQAELISKYMKHPFCRIDKELTLKGVKKIYDSLV